MAFPDSELEILPYNRVVRDLNGLSPDALISQIEQRFIVKHRDEPVEPEQKGTFGMVVDRGGTPCKSSKRWCRTIR